MNIHPTIQQSRTTTARYWPTGLGVLLTITAATALTRPTARALADEISSAADVKS